MDWTTIITAVISFLGGGGLWAVIKARVDKKKTPYDMLLEMMTEQKKYYAEKNAEFEKEKRDSAEKSYILAQTRKCKHRFTDPSVTCPVDEANEARLQNKCNGCEFNRDGDEDND